MTFYIPGIMQDTIIVGWAVVLLLIVERRSRVVADGS
jgi:hypothetical protein